MSAKPKRRGQDRFKGYGRRIYASSAGRSGEAEFAATFYEDIDRIPALVGVPRRVLDQQPY